MRHDPVWRFYARDICCFFTAENRRRRKTTAMNRDRVIITADFLSETPPARLDVNTPIVRSRPRSRNGSSRIRSEPPHDRRYHRDSLIGAQLVGRAQRTTASKFESLSALSSGARLVRRPVRNPPRYTFSPQRRPGVRQPPRDVRATDVRDDAADGEPCCCALRLLRQGLVFDQIRSSP